MEGKIFDAGVGVGRVKMFEEGAGRMFMAVEDVVCEEFAIMFKELLEDWGCKTFMP